MSFSPPQVPTTIPHDLSLNDFEYWNRYFEMMVITMIIGRFPDVLSGFLILLFENFKALLCI